MTDAVKKSKRAPRHHHSVYVVLLSKDVLYEPKHTCAEKVTGYGRGDGQ